MMFLRICGGGFAHPLPIFVGFSAGGHAFSVGGSVTFDHRPEFIPVNLAMQPIATYLVITQIRIWDLDAACLQVRRQLIKELLSQFIIGSSLNAPADKHAA